jgi:hypothetical protein
MTGKDWNALLKTFMDRADKVGVTGRRFVLCILAIIAALLMAHGVAPGWCIAFVVIIYALEPAAEIVWMLISHRTSGQKLASDRTEFRHFVNRRRRRLRGSEPELPLQLPNERPSNDQDEGQ